LTKKRSVWVRVRCGNGILWFVRQGHRVKVTWARKLITGAGGPALG